MAAVAKCGAGKICRGWSWTLRFWVPTTLLEEKLC